MATIATLVVDMQANTAEFVKTWDKTSDKVKGGSGAFKDAEKAALSFAQKGLSGIAQGVPGAERAIEKLISSMQKSNSMLLKIGGGLVLAVGAFQQAFELGQKLGETLREQIIPALTGQQSTEQLLESMKKAQEEERKFLDERKASVNLIRDMERSKAAAYTEAAVARAKADGDEQAAVQAALNGKLQAIEQEKAARVAQAIEATAHTKDAVLRERLITAAVQEESAKKSAAYASAAAEFNRIETERLSKALESIKKEADANQAAIDKAVAARQALSAAGSAAAQALGITSITNRDKVLQFGKNIEDLVKKFYMLREAGVPIGDAVAEAFGELTAGAKSLRQEISGDVAATQLFESIWRKFNFGDLRANIDDTRKVFEAQGIALTQVNDQIQQQINLNAQVADAARKAGAGLDDLAKRAWAVAEAFYAANVQMVFFDNNS